MNTSRLGGLALTMLGTVLVVAGGVYLTQWPTDLTTVTGCVAFRVFPLLGMAAGIGALTDGIRLLVQSRSGRHERTGDLPPSRLQPLLYALAFIFFLAMLPALGWCSVTWTLTPSYLLGAHSLAYVVLLVLGTVVLGTLFVRMERRLRK